MDIKQVQNEMKANILQHQNTILQTKLKTIQQTIASLGKKQNELIRLKKATIKTDDVQKKPAADTNGFGNREIATQNMKELNTPLNLTAKNETVASPGAQPQKFPNGKIERCLSISISKPSDNLRMIYSNTTVTAKQLSNRLNNVPENAQKIFIPNPSPINATIVDGKPGTSNGGDKSLFVFSNKPSGGKQLYRILPKDKQAFKTIQSLTIVPTSSRNTMVSNHLTSLGVWNKLNENKSKVTQKPTVFSPKMYQKFRIKDGKTVPIELSSVAPKPTETLVIGKPRNDALKEVLAQAKSVNPEKSQISLTQQVPKKLMQIGFTPITCIASAMVSQTANTLSYTVNQKRPPSRSSQKVEADNIITIGDDCETQQSQQEKDKQIEYLRELELVPTEVAKSMLSRRFSKRKTAANPVYSGGIYVAHNDLKRTSPYIDVMEMAPPRKMRSRQKLKQTETVEDPVLKSLVESNSELSRLMGTFDSKKANDNNQLVIDEKRNSPSTSQKGGKKYKRKRKKKSTNNIDGHDDQCNVCNEAGEVLMCDTCSLVYHLECCTPPLDQVPVGMWVCRKCKDQFKTSKCDQTWSGVTNAVHAYFIHQNRISGEHSRLETEVDACKSTKQKLELQQKQLRDELQSKLILRSRALREGKVLDDKLQELSSILKAAFKRTKLLPNDSTTSTSINSKGPS